MNSSGRLARTGARSRGVRSALYALVGATSIWLNPAAAAPPNRIATRLDWGVSVCGDAEGFASRVLKRTRAVRFVEAGEQLTVRLSIEPQGSGLDASVTLVGRGASGVTRHIASPDCDDALDALALVVAISLEARAHDARAAAAGRPPGRTTPRRTPARAKPVDPPAPAGSAPDVDPELPSPALPEPDPAPPVAVAEPEPVAPSPPPSQDPPPAVVAPSEAPDLTREADRVTAKPQLLEHVELAAGVSAQLSIGVAPEALVGAQLWLRAVWERNSWLSPEAALSYGYQRRGGFVQADGEADFALGAAALDVCPLRVGVAALHLRPCVSGALGRLNAVGHETFFPRTENRPWSSFGANAQLVARLGIVKITASFGVAKPMVRDRFRFGSECSGAACEVDVFHRVHAAVWSGAAGAGLAFW